MRGHAQEAVQNGKTRRENKSTAKAQRWNNKGYASRNHARERRLGSDLSLSTAAACAPRPAVLIPPLCPPRLTVPA